MAEWIEHRSGFTAEDSGIIQNWVKLITLKLVLRTASLRDAIVYQRCNENTESCAAWKRT